MWKELQKIDISIATLYDINISPNFIKCSFNYPECNEKCIRGEYIVKYTGDRKILLTFQDKWIQSKFVDQLNDWLKLIK